MLLPHRRPWLIVLSLLIVPAAALARDNELTPEELSAGWQLLFNGQDHTGWKNNNDRPIATKIEEDSLVPFKAGGYVMMYDKKFGDFILQCDVKMSSENCNSGVFLRMGNPRDPVQSGFEIQVYRGGTDYHSFGAIYDLVPPSKNVVKPAGEWNHFEIKCLGPRISVKVNGEQVAEIDVDKFDQPGRRADGTKHKFKLAARDFPREGYLGFQDHGQKVWYKNIKLLPLKP